MVVPGCKLAAAFAVLVFCSSWETGNARRLGSPEVQEGHNSAGLKDLPYLNHVISKHARMLLEDTSPLISQREPGIRARLDHVNQGQALSDRTRIIAVVCVVIVLGVLAACCCLKPEIHERKESSGGLSDTFTCGMSEANSDTFLVKDHRGKSDMASNLHNLGDLPPDGARHGVRRSDECVILVSIQAPPNTSPRRIEQ